ncbi:hypothetical protein LZC95_10205 [Pendulispora brunnea]|uniref:Uncharacterized protein n=1 Tax=Pendulispora brunnea TaxID=2905690 RepID=A0ABZ2KLG5_9BACT
MDSTRARIVRLLAERRPYYIEACERLIAEAPPETVRDHTPEAAAQMTDGLLKLLVEGLENRGTEVRALYIDTLIPALVAAGVPMRGIVGGAVHLGFIISHDVARHIPQEEQDTAAEWFALFYADYVTELAKTVAREQFTHSRTAPKAGPEGARGA